MESHSFGEIWSLSQTNMAWIICVFWKELKILLNYLMIYHKHILMYLLVNNLMATSRRFGQVQLPGHPGGIRRRPRRQAVTT